MIPKNFRLSYTDVFQVNNLDYVYLGLAIYSDISV